MLYFFFGKVSVGESWVSFGDCRRESGGGVGHLLTNDYEVQAEEQMRVQYKYNTKYMKPVKR